jgi:hypothetical protein
MIRQNSGIHQEDGEGRRRLRPVVLDITRLE